MSPFRTALLAATALLPLAARAQTPPPAATVAPLAFTERTLANGLRVYALRDTTTPNVSVQVWYDVGSKDDPAGRSGFAHMFEHLMFKATRNLVPEQMDRLTEDVGGNNNASTNDDYTEYHEVIPANHLERLIWAEADRMGSLAVQPDTFASERLVVEEELRQSTLARPYGKLFSLYYPALAYTRHPYARGTIGSIADLDSATIDDIRGFHAVYYRPDNAVLVVSGNFDPKQLDGWVDKYMGPIAGPATAIPRVTVAEPERAAPVSRTVYEPNTPLPAVLIAWAVPADRDPDNAPLNVLKAVLADGESSRLYQSLVYRDQLAQSAESFLDTKQSTGNLVAFAMTAGGKKIEDVEAALRREVARLRDAPASAAELAKAKNQILAAAIRRRETAEGRGTVLASSVIVDGDPHAEDRQLTAIARVTAADVQRVARKYLTDTRAATIRYLPAEAKPAGASSTPITVAATVETHPLAAPANVAVVTPAWAAERIAPPPAAGPVAARIPAAVEERLANGLHVVTVEKHGLPLVTAELVAIGGGAADPSGRDGASSLSADLLTKGTATRSATRIASEIESLGAAIDSDAGRDAASVDVTVLSSGLAPALALLADVAQHPAFAPEELERARAQAIDAATVAVKDPAQLSGLVANRAVFGATPYGTVLDGTPQSLAAVTRADVTAAYARTWRPDRAALVLVGDITPAKARELAQANFGGWRASGPAPAAPAAPANYPKPRVIVVDMADAGQAGVTVARVALPRADSRYYAAAVANTVLGGGFSSRLNQEIRIKRGLAYGASSRLSARRLPGLVGAATQTKNPTAPEVVALITAEMQRLGRTAPAAAELDTRKAVLVGGFGHVIETTVGMAGAVADRLSLDVPLAELQSYSQAVQAVTPEAVRAAAADVLDPAQASIVVVGDGKLFLPELRKAYPQLELIPATALKLGTAALK